MTTTPPPAADDRCHMWPFGERITLDSRCVACGITWDGHYGQPLCHPEVVAGRGAAAPCGMS